MSKTGKSPIYGKRSGADGSAEKRRPRIAVIADAFLPMRTSGAVQIRDLVEEMAFRGYEVTLFTPDSSISSPWAMDTWHGVRVLRLRSPKTKDLDYVRRAIGEFLMPLAMLWHMRSSPVGTDGWDGVVWYAPSIFLWPLAYVLKRRSACRGYLIVRDIFPEWALDVGILRRGMAYRMFKIVEHLQYRAADIIGVQSPANLAYFSGRRKRSGQSVEVLNNWLALAPDSGCSVDVGSTALAGRKLFVYAGNMGVAQGMDVMVGLAEALQERTDIGFLFVGRGTDRDRLKSMAVRRKLSNILFFDEIDPREIPGLYLQCHVGLISLDLRHRTHNIPGKFLSYMQAGLPVLAVVNRGNDLELMISGEGVGRVSTDGALDTLRDRALELVDDREEHVLMAGRCRRLASRLFDPSIAVGQIVSALGLGAPCPARDRLLPAAGKPKVLLAVNSAWNLHNFRMGLIRRLLDEGYDVLAVAPFDGYSGSVSGSGVRYRALEMDSRGRHPGRDLRLFFRLLLILRKERPAVFLGFTIKPNIYGALAARLLGIAVINNITGLGRAFSGSLLLRAFVSRFYRFALASSAKVYFQNEEDRLEFVRSGMVPPSLADRLPGSGVDLDHFRCDPPGEGRQGFRFLLVARMLWEKGVGEYVEAARIIRSSVPDADFCLLGFLGGDEAGSVSLMQMESWNREGVVRYLGDAGDVRPFIADADCIVLPSYYREGVPRSLLEAAAMGRPVITTDMPGCRDAVDDGVSGLLCRPKDAADLADKMARLLALPIGQRRAMGLAARKKVEAEFDERLVVEHYLRSIRDIVGAQP